LGRRVPEDVAVTGFDDIELASLVTPKLTTVHVPRYGLGEELMKGLLRKIEADGDYEEQTRIELETVVRESCGATVGVATSQSLRAR
jgi:LacI family transcriptional regulator